MSAKPCIRIRRVNSISARTAPVPGVHSDSGRPLPKSHGLDDGALFLGTDRTGEWLPDRTFMTIICLCRHAVGRLVDCFDLQDATGQDARASRARVKIKLADCARYAQKLADAAQARLREGRPRGELAHDP